jgi:hypothetical protein
MMEKPSVIEKLLDHALEAKQVLGNEDLSANLLSRHRK